MAHKSPLRILHVEDDDIDLEALARSLRKRAIDHEIVVARDGLEALRVLREDEESPLKRPFIVLLDLNMPRMNGHEFLRELRSDPDLRTTVVFILTTSLAEKDILEAHDFNVAGYISKENAGRQFMDLVEQLEGYWRLTQLPS